MLTIDKPTFEQNVPAFKDATSQIFNRIQGFILDAVSEVESLCGDLPENETISIEREATRLACLKAARAAVPHLDLVITPTGFGIVSNQNVAPASAHRVDALKEELRKSESLAYDILIVALLNTSWKDSAKAAEIIDSLLWSPTLCTDFGMIPEGKIRPYREEYDALKPIISDAQWELSRIISQALLDRLIEMQRTPTETNASYMQVMKLCRQYIAATYSKGYIRSTKKAKDAILAFLFAHLDDLPEYKNSAEYKAISSQRYENKESDGTFFFS